MNSEIWGIRLPQKSSTAIYRKAPPNEHKTKNKYKKSLYIRVKNKKKKIKEKQEKNENRKASQWLIF